MSGAPRLPADIDRQRALDLGLAEFSALKQEIAARIAAQYTLIGVAVTATGTLFALVLSRRTSTDILLAVPFITTALGLFGLDQLRQVSLIGMYVRDELWPYIGSLTLNHAATHGDQIEATASIPSWERALTRYRRRSTWLQRWLVSVPHAGIFVLSGVLALIASAESGLHAGNGLWVIWVLGLVMTVAYPCLALLTSLMFTKSMPGSEEGAGARSGSSSPPARVRSLSAFIDAISSRWLQRAARRPRC